MSALSFMSRVTFASGLDNLGAMRLRCRSMGATSSEGVGIRVQYTDRNETQHLTVRARTRWVVWSVAAHPVVEVLTRLPRGLHRSHGSIPLVMTHAPSYLTRI